MSFGPNLVQNLCAQLNLVLLGFSQCAKIRVPVVVINPGNFLFTLPKLSKPPNLMCKHLVYTLTYQICISFSLECKELSVELLGVFQFFKAQLYCQKSGYWCPIVLSPILDSVTFKKTGFT